MSRFSRITAEQQRAYDARMPDDDDDDIEIDDLDIDDDEPRWRGALEALNRRCMYRYPDEGADRWEKERQRMEDERLDELCCRECGGLLDTHDIGSCSCGHTGHGRDVADYLEE